MTCERDVELAAAHDNASNLTALNLSTQDATLDAGSGAPIGSPHASIAKYSRSSCKGSKQSRSMKLSEQACGTADGRPTVCQSCVAIDDGDADASQHSAGQKT